MQPKFKSDDTMDEAFQVWTPLLVDTFFYCCSYGLCIGSKSGYFDLSTEFIKKFRVLQGVLSPFIHISSIDSL
jgi:hypothetical protein